MKVGFHIPIVDGNYLESIKTSYIDYGADAMQIWTGNPKSFYCKLLENTDPIKNYVEKNNIFLISHSPYLLNFVRNDQKLFNRYILDSKNIHNMGGIGSVLHMGFNVASLGLDTQQAMKSMIDNLEIVSKDVPGKIILENMSGKGTSLGCRLEEWAEFANMFPESLNKKVVWCVDTAHLHGVGEYNLSSRREVMRFYDDFDDLIGWNKILCFHFNGSSANLGSHLDLHADIGHEMCGNIESKGMRHLVRIANETEKHLILETGCNEYPIGWQIATIRSWIDPNHPMHTLFGSTRFV